MTATGARSRIRLLTNLFPLAIATEGLVAERAWALLDVKAWPIALVCFFVVGYQTVALLRTWRYRLAVFVPNHRRGRPSREADSLSRLFLVTVTAFVVAVPTPLVLL